MGKKEVSKEQGDANIRAFIDMEVRTAGYLKLRISRGTYKRLRRSIYEVNCDFRRLGDSAGDLMDPNSLDDLALAALAALDRGLEVYEHECETRWSMSQGKFSRYTKRAQRRDHRRYRRRRAWRRLKRKFRRKTKES